MRRKPTTHRPPRQAVLPASDRCCRPRFSSREPGPCGEGPSPPALCPEARRALAPLLNPRPATVQTGPGAQHTGGRVCTRAHTHAHADPQEGHPAAASGGGGPAGWPAHPGAFRPLPARAAISSPGPGGHATPPSLQMAGARNRLSPRRQGRAWPGSECGRPDKGPSFPYQQPGTRVACLPTACAGGPWLGRAARHSGQCSTWPRRAHGLRGAMQGDTPRQTCGLQTPPPQQGHTNTCASACTGHTHAPRGTGAAAARPPRGHACPHSVRAGRTGLSEDARPGFESRPNPHELARTRPASELSASPGGAAVRTARLPGLSGARSQRRSIRGARCMTGVAARQDH